MSSHPDEQDYNAQRRARMREIRTGVIVRFNAIVCACVMLAPLSLTLLSRAAGIFL